MKVRTTYFAMLSMLCLGANCCFAQDEDSEAPATGAIIVSSTSDMDDSGSGISGTRVMAIESSDLAAGPMFFADNFGGNLGFSSGFGGNSFSMLNNPSVQKDLALVDDQLDQIKEINEEFSEKIKEQMENMKDENGNFNIQGGSDFGQLIKDLQQQQQEQIEGLLLPNQQKRLEQVSRQMRIKQMGTSKALTSQLAEELGLTSDQQKRIKNRSKELQKELEAKIAELRANAKKDLLSELSKDQRKKLEELIGDQYVEKEEDSSNRFQRMMHRQKTKSRDF